MKLKPLSSVYGRISQVLLVLPEALLPEEFLESTHMHESKEISPEKIQEFTNVILNHYGGIFRALSDRVEFVILCARAIKKSVQEAMKQTQLLSKHHILITTEAFHQAIQGNARLEGGNKELEAGIWVQDPFCVLCTMKGEPVLLEPFYLGSDAELPQAGDRVIAERIGSRLRIPILPTRFMLEGGNILAADDYLFVGRNLLERNRKKYYSDLSLEEAEKKIRNKFKRLFGVKYVYFPGVEKAITPNHKNWNPGPEALQPFYHLDLFMTLGGRDNEGNEIIFLAELTDSDIQNLNPVNQTAAKAIKAALNEVSEYFQYITSELPGPKFKVEKLLLKIVETSEGFRIHTYNNCLIECFAGVKRAYLPQYKGNHNDGFSTEGKNKKIFERNGFGVIWVNHDFEELIKKQGSLHCITQVLVRT